MVGVTNKINYYCCGIFRGAPAPTAPMVLTPVIESPFPLPQTERAWPGVMANQIAPTTCCVESVSV